MKQANAYLGPPVKKDGIGWYPIFLFLSIVCFRGGTLPQKKKR